MYGDAPVTWRFNGACTDADPDLFFPASSRPEASAPALAICSACPVKAECRDFAVRHRMLYGIWGGLIEPELRALVWNAYHNVNAIESWQVDHGTPAGARWHRRQGEQPCPPCLRVERSRKAAHARDVYQAARNG